MLRDYWRVVRGFERSIVLWLAAWAFIGFAYFGIQSVLLNLYLLRLGFGTEFIGVLIGSGQLVWAALALPAGIVGSRIGLRQAMVASLVLIAACTGLLLAVEALPREVWVYWLFGCWIAMWVGAALWTVNTTPYLMAVASPEERNYAFSAQLAILSAAALFGSLVAGVLPGALASWLGGSLAESAPYRWVLLLVPPMYLFAALLLSRAKMTAPTRDETRSAARSRPPVYLFLLFGLVIFLERWGEGSVRAFFNVYLDSALRVDTVQIGVLLGVAQVVPIFAALVSPALLARAGPAGAYVLACVGQTGALLLLGASPMLAGASLGFVGVMTTVGLVGPAMTLLSQESVMPRWRTTMSAVNTIGQALGWAIAAAAGGYLVASIGFGGMFFVGGIFALASGALVFVVGRLALLRDRPTSLPALAGSGREVAHLGQAEREWQLPEASHGHASPGTEVRVSEAESDAA